MSDERPFDRERVLPLLDRSFRDSVPHNAALGFRAVDCGPGLAVLELPWAPHLVGNPDTGVLHGGAITALLDACCGASVFLALRTPVAIATLDLRIDYLKPAAPGRTVVARAECYKVGRSVAFARAFAFCPIEQGPFGQGPFEQGEADPIASAAATFMLSTKGKAVVAARGEPG